MIVNSLRRAEIITIALHKRVADTVDLDRFLKAWFWHRPISTDQDPVGALIMVAGSMGQRNLTEAEAKEIIAASKCGRPLRKADSLGMYLRLSDQERAEWGIRTIGAHDVSKRQRTLRRKRQRREREAHRRRRNGAIPHSQSLSRAQPWKAEGVSRRTWERRRVANSWPMIDANSCPDLSQIRGQYSSFLSTTNLRQRRESKGPSEKVLDRRARLKQETAVQKERTPMAVTNWCQETTSAASVSPTSLVLENGLLLTRRWIAARERPCGNGRANGSHPAEAGPKQELSPPLEGRMGGCEEASSGAGTGISGSSCGACEISEVPLFSGLSGCRSFIPSSPIRRSIQEASHSWCSQTGPISSPDAT